MVHWLALTLLSTLANAAGAVPVRLPDGVREDFAGYSLFVSIHESALLSPKDGAPPAMRVPKEADYKQAEKTLAGYRSIARKLFDHYFKRQSLFTHARKYIEPGESSGPFTTISFGAHYPSPAESQTHVVASAPELRINLKAAVAKKWDWLTLKIQTEFMSSITTISPELFKEARERIGSVEMIAPYFTGGVSPFGEAQVFLAVLKEKPEGLGGKFRRFREVLQELKTGGKGPIGTAWLPEILEMPSSEAEGWIHWLGLTTPDRQWKAQYPRLMEAVHTISKRGVGTTVDGTLWAINRSALYKE